MLGKSLPYHLTCFRPPGLSTVLSTRIKLGFREGLRLVDLDHFWSSLGPDPAVLPHSPQLLILGTGSANLSGKMGLPLWNMELF